MQSEISLVVELDLPKVGAWVRFPHLALLQFCIVCYDISMNISVYWLIPAGAFLMLTYLMPFLRKHKFIREPIGKYGWGFVKGDFQIRWLQTSAVIIFLGILFYLIYRWVVQFA